MYVLLFIILLHLSIVLSIPSNNWDPSNITYPYARRSDTAFIYASKKFGQVSVPDPYNHFEQDVNKSNETKSFVDAQIALTNSYFNQNKDLDSICKSISHLYQYIDVDSIQPFGSDDHIQYLYKVLALNQSRPVWYIATQIEMEQSYHTGFFRLPGKRWFDENLLSKDGSDTIDQFNLSPDGKLAAYLVVKGGSYKEIIYVRNISSPFLHSSETETGRLPEVIPYNDGGSVQWIPDSSAFFYTQQLDEQSPKGGYGSRIRFHKVGTKYEDDITIVDYPDDPYQYWGLLLSGDKKWIMALLYKGVDLHNAVYVASLEDQSISSTMKWQSIAPGLNSSLVSFGSINSTFFFATDADNARNFKIVKVEVDNSKARKVKQLTELTECLETQTIIPERSDAQLEVNALNGNVPLFDGDKLLIYYTKNANQEIFVYNLLTLEKYAQVLDDNHGTILSFFTDQSSKEVFLSTATMNKPKTIFRLWFEGDKLQSRKIFDAQIEGVDLDSIISERRFSTSKDGTQVPITMFYKKGTNFDGQNPALIYFYGQYGYNILPKFTPKFLEWIFGYGGVIFWASPRGGGENGFEWHLAGQRQYRQNTVDDVISVAEYAIEQNISAMGKIVVSGGSAAGTTCMVVTNQAKEGLLGGTLCERGVYDMLRFKILQVNGPSNVVEYGDPQDPSDFDYLIKYSPLENVNKTKSYPTVLLQLNANDDNVNPVNSYKMIAELQYDLSKNENPLLLYVGQEAGHSTTRTSRNFNIEIDTIEIAVMMQGMGLIKVQNLSNRSSLYYGQ